MTSVLGIHHVTAIASDPQRNVDFYVGLLGLRFVKRTVNFDDPQTYHFYFGDDTGSPGSIMTFFPWPGARRGRQGTGQIAVTSFAVHPRALGFWIERLLRHGIAYDGPAKRGAGADAEQVIAFKDHDGLMLELVAHPGVDARPAWGNAPGIAREHAIHGFHSVTLWVETLDETEKVLVGTLGLRHVREDAGIHRFAAADGGPGTIVNVRAIGGFTRGLSGAGTVHHVAFGVTDEGAQGAMRERVLAAGMHPTPPIDRSYFRSVYFREPAGVLYELATMAPGFAVDEPIDRLGERLMLPAQFEPLRAEIEAALPPIRLPGQTDVPLAAEGATTDHAAGTALDFAHRYIPPTAAAEATGSATLLMLHGTGGDENDLVPLGQAILPGAAILSPRGKVLERGAPRFFRRLAEGVFDLEDLARRTDELAEFIASAAAAYGFDRDGVIAVGFSNGANIAASLLLRRPGVLRAAVLLSPMVPFTPETLPALRGTAVFIGAGRADPIVPVAHVERLAAMLRDSGAEVTVHWQPGGHSITPGEVDAARHWVAGCVSEAAR